MGPHFKKMVQDINANLRSQVASWKKEVEALQEEDAENPDTSRFTVEHPLGWTQLSGRLRRNQPGQFQLNAKSYTEAVQAYLRKLNDELPMIAKRTRREMGGIKKTATNEERRAYLETYQKTLIKKLETAFPELHGVVSGNASLEGMSFRWNAKSSKMMTKGVLPDFTGSLDPEVRKALANQGLQKDLYSQVNSMVAGKMDGMTEFFSKKGYADATLGSPVVSFAETQDQKDQQSILKGMASPMSWQISNGAFKGKSLGDLFALIQGNDKETLKLRKDLKVFQEKIRRDHDMVFSGAEKAYKQALMAYTMKNSSKMLPGVLKRGLDQIKQAYDKRLQILNDRMQQKLKSAGAGLFEKNRSLLQMRKRAAQWILDTHAALESNPAHFTAHFTARGIRRRTKMENNFTQVFATVFRETDRRLGLVSEAGKYLGILDVQESDLEGSYVQNVFYVNKSGKKSRTQRVRYRGPRAGEGEGFAVSDVERRRVYKPRMRDIDFFERQHRFKERMGYSGPYSVFKNLPADMDPGTRGKYQRVLSALEKIPARPAKEVYVDPVTKEVKKGYRVQVGPLMIRRNWDGSMSYEKRDVYQGARKQAAELLKGLKQKTVEKTGINVWLAIQSASEYMTNDRKVNSAINDVLGAKVAGLKTASSKRTKFNSLMDMIYGVQDKRSSYNLGEDRDERTAEERQKDASIGLQYAKELGYAAKIQKAKTHEQLNEIQSHIYEQVMSGSGISTLLEKNKESNRMLFQAVDLAQLFRVAGQEAPDVFPNTYQGRTLELEEFGELVHRTAKGEDISEDLGNIFQAQAEEIYSNNQRLRLKEYPNMPVKTMIALRRMQLNNEGSKT